MQNASAWPEVPVVGIDWGSTHRRAFALDAQGVCVHRMVDADGALASKDRFAQATAHAIHTLAVRPQRVLLSGMVGSALGWVQVPYVGPEVALTDLRQHLHAVTPQPGLPPCFIVPGYLLRNAQGQPDVMRGEETQLLGALSLGYDTGWFGLPGTHSKWVELRAGRIVQLRTYLTGELFDLLSHKGTLAAASVASAVGSLPEWDDTAFAQGVEASRHGALSHLLFGCRARVVCGDMAPAALRAYLSGVLIGYEMNDVLQSAAGAAPMLHLIASPTLSRLYAVCAEQLANAGCTSIDAQHAYLGALAQLQAN